MKSTSVTDYTTHRAIEALAWYFANRDHNLAFDVDAEWDESRKEFRIVVTRDGRWADGVLPGFFKPGFDITDKGHASVGWIEDITGRAIKRWLHTHAY